MPDCPLPAQFSPTDEWLALVHGQLGGLNRTLHQILDRLPEPEKPAEPAAAKAQPVELREPDASAKSPADTSRVELTQDEPETATEEAPAGPAVKPKPRARTRKNSTK